MAVLRSNEYLRYLLLIFFALILAHSAQSAVKCKPVSVEPFLRTDSKLVLEHARKYVNVYRKLELAQIVTFIEPSSPESERSFVKARLESREGRNLHHAVAVYCVEEIRPATDGFHSVVSGRAFYRHESSPEEFFFYTSIEEGRPFFTHLMFARTDTFHLSGAKPIVP